MKNRSEKNVKKRQVTSSEKSTGVGKGFVRLPRTGPVSIVSYFHVFKGKKVILILKKNEVFKDARYSNNLHQFLGKSRALAADNRNLIRQSLNINKYFLKS